MAQINTPTNWKSTIFDGETSIDSLFSYTLAASDQLVSFTVVPSEDLSPDGIFLDGNRLYGKVNDYFDGKVDLVLKYRDRTSLQISQTNSFASLPEPTTCDLIAFNPPSELKKVVTYTQTLVYDDITDPVLPVRKTVSDSINMTIIGSFDGWVAKFRAYVSSSGPFPKLGI
ncbi:hypothetical protein [Aeromonas phage AS-yj]|uniref:Uncharacterized protein n=1 Tax=Aeromonas phage AS-yj TaxID=2026115 RepID=A0A291LEC6_9CAUD|nr:hypothetical protein [Aeromonas phage AS-yj]